MQYISSPGVQLTPIELRLTAYEAFSAIASTCMWEIGAGSGAISIEWQLRDPSCHIYAVESNTDRVNDILRNVQVHQTPNIKVLGLDAPDGFDALERPDIIFHGCPGESTVDLYPILWDFLLPGGVLTSNAHSFRGQLRMRNALIKYGGAIRKFDAYEEVRYQYIAYKSK